MAFVVMLTPGSRVHVPIRDMPGMLNKSVRFCRDLPRRYPARWMGIIDAAENMRTRMLNMGDSVVKYSLASLVGLLAVYLVLVPLMVFHGKDKSRC